MTVLPEGVDMTLSHGESMCKYCHRWIQMYFNYCPFCGKQRIGSVYTEDTILKGMTIYARKEEDEREIP